MLFKKQDGQVFRVDPSKVELLILGPTGGAESILSQFNDSELRSIMQWAREQQATDLARWPGWQGACERLHLDTVRSREVADALLARLAGPTAS
jgi:hypothetical protein